jgi:hypothetical protein
LFQIIVAQVSLFVLNIGMIGSKQRLINEVGDELDDELDTTSLILIGGYRKRLQMKPRGRLGSVVGQEVHDRSRQEYDMKLYRDYFSERPTYLDKFSGSVFE